MGLNQINEFKEIFKERFQRNMKRHPGLTWDQIDAKLNHKDVLEKMLQMEQSGGEPDIFLINDQLYVMDASKETPKGRLSCCYDEEARLSRKKFPPETSAHMLAKAMGIKLVDETLYLAMQAMDDFDLKTSSWIETPAELRKLGGALFGDKRYGRTFIYHNGADSYYGSRGFRGYFVLN
jgi:hypothetical protein